MKITIYGASDDLVEVEGDISEEFTYDSRDGDDEEPGGAYLAVSDGTLLRIVYGGKGGGLWRITPIKRGSATYEKREATDEDRDYSDRVTLEGDAIKWIAFATDYAPKRARD